MIEKYFTTEADIYRMVAHPAVEADPTATPPVLARPYSQEEEKVATVKGHLQQADAEIAEGFALERSRTFTFWCGLGADVQIGDKVVLNGLNYGAKGVIDYNTGENKHKEVILWNTP
jgi:hypothetical protein